MDPREVKTVDDARAIVEASSATHVKVGVFDIDGILRGKYMSRSKFLSSLTGGYGFCDVVLGWDSNDQLYDNASTPAGTRGIRMRRCGCCRRAAGGCPSRVTRCSS